MLKVTLFVMIVTAATQDEPQRMESIQTTVYPNAEMCKQARKKIMKNLRYLGFDGQTNQQIYVWCG